MNSDNVEEISRVIDSWMRPFRSFDGANQLRNSLTVSPDITEGVTEGEVENVLGVPISRILIRENLYYKYEDMIIVLVDGKVADMKF